VIVVTRKRDPRLPGGMEKPGMARVLASSL